MCYLTEKKVVELQQKLKDFATELDCEKTKNDELQREHEQQSIHLHVKTDRLENEIASLQQQLLAQKKNSELHIQLLQSQVQDKGATVLHLEVSENFPKGLYFETSAGSIDRHSTASVASARADSKTERTECILKFSD